MFKILIANRGEIAIRVMRACRDLGIQTVAVYSDADRQALHVRYADQAYPIGPAHASESYLRLDRIMDAARQSGADAIHPGYGFLAERADLAQACAEAGLIFIGPPAAAIQVLSDKAAARAAMHKLGLPIVPGTNGQGRLHDEDILALAPTVGFPLLIKPSAGNGGKGIRLVERLQDLPSALAPARREAEAAFGHGGVYLEKAIPEARHIEIQWLADQHGNVIHLGERECSIQHARQKLMDEAPAPALDDDLRARLGAAAVCIAQATAYVNAGAAEFLLDRDKNLYFLEANACLPAGHSATEMVTHVDMVKEQIRIARGRPLRYTQADIRLNGWAIECRVNAEDPFAGFRPSTGRIARLVCPTGPGVRVDSGVCEGYEITPDYDPLLAKIIAWGKTRAEAILRMRGALDECCIIGVQTNIPFFRALLNSHRFMAGQFDTTFVEKRFAMNNDISPESRYVAAIAAAFVAHQRRQPAAPGGRHATFSAWKWGKGW